MGTIEAIKCPRVVDVGCWREPFSVMWPVPLRPPVYPAPCGYSERGAHRPGTGPLWHVATSNTAYSRPNDEKRSCAYRWCPTWRIQMSNVSHTHFKSCPQLFFSIFKTMTRLYMGFYARGRGGQKESELFGLCVGFTLQSPAVGPGKRPANIWITKLGVIALLLRTNGNSRWDYTRGQRGAYLAKIAETIPIGKVH